MMNPPPPLIDGIGQLIVVIAMIGGLTIGLVVGVSALYFHYKRQQLWHETARLALERGHPLPPAAAPADLNRTAPPPGVDFLEWHARKRAETRSQATKSGLVLVAFGAALTFLLWNLRAKGMWAIGAIPGFIGVALLAHSFFESLFAKSRPPAPPET